MIRLALLALAQAAAPPAEDEIVVIARRLQQASVVVGRDDRGRFTCSLTATSGSAVLDERLCRVASTCVIKGASDRAAVGACVDRKKPGLLAAFRSEYKARR